MIGTSSDKKMPEALKAEAARWFAALRAPHCDADTQRAFDTWIKADPAHELAYEQCSALWLMTNGLRDDDDIKRELEAARSQIKSTSRHNKNNWGPLLASKRFAQIAAVLLLGFGFIYGANFFSGEHYLTGVGEQRLVQMPDGSTAMLNTDTEIKVRYSRQQRRIDLIKGEAYFDVRKDPHRPFEVIADNAVVRAVGTEFNVSLLDYVLSVDVAEGVVAFNRDAENQTSEPTTLTVGERIAFRKGNHPATIEAARLERIAAWQTHKIYFNADNLSDAVAEYNRYIKEKIIIVDHDLNQQKITGIFNVGDLDTFIFSLEQAFNVRVERNKSKILVMHK